MTRLTAYSHGAGCACKLGPAELAEVLGGLAPVAHPDLVVGPESGDDALVWRREGDGRALVATTDFFTPIVDDARTWGAVAAANAASDVYAMGGRPLFALNLVAWPREQLPLSLLDEVLQGAAEVAARGGWVVAGGHTIDGAEPLYGQAVVGEVEDGALLTNAGARPGQVVVLTKALGTGVVTTALKRGEVEDAVYQAAVASMTRLNDEAARAAHGAGATAATDVTGFGLLGHAHELAFRSGVRVVIEAESLPLLPGALELAEQGVKTGGDRRNREYAETHVESAALPALELLSYDPQTAGGLLVSVPGERAAVLEATLAGRALFVRRVGRVLEGAGVAVEYPR
jgi:selenide,water dikinase